MDIATKQVIIFKLCGKSLAVPIDQIREIVKPLDITPLPRTAAYIEGLTNLRGEIFPVINLAKKLDLVPPAETDKTRFLIVDSDNGSAGIIVDEASEIINIPLDNIVKNTEMVKDELLSKYLTGIGRNKDKLILIIDLIKITFEEKNEQ